MFTLLSLLGDLQVCQDRNLFEHELQVAKVIDMVEIGDGILIKRICMNSR